MKIYVLLHFQHKNDVIIIVKLLYRATSRRRENEIENETGIFVYQNLSLGVENQKQIEF